MIKRFDNIRDISFDGDDDFVLCKKFLWTDFLVFSSSIFLPFWTNEESKMRNEI